MAADNEDRDDPGATSTPTKKQAGSQDLDMKEQAENDFDDEV